MARYKLRKIEDVAVLLQSIARIFAWLDLAFWMQSCEKEISGILPKFSFKQHIERSEMWLARNQCRSYYCIVDGCSAALFIVIFLRFKTDIVLIRSHCAMAWSRVVRDILGWDFSTILFSCVYITKRMIVPRFKSMQRNHLFHHDCIVNLITL